MPNGFDNIRGSIVLLVEDNDINQQLALELLSDEGFFVVVAENGKIGIEKYKESIKSKFKTPYYDLVLMDLQMPVMDGRRSTKEIRLYEQHCGIDCIPIIAMTADAMSGVREEVISLGMNDYITKPIDPSEMFKTLFKWIKPAKRSLPDGYTQKLKAEQDKDKNLSSLNNINSSYINCNNNIRLQNLDEITLPHLDGVNTTIGIARVNGNKRLYVNLLKKFYRDNQDITKQILEAIEQQNQDVAVRLAHTVKGLSGTIGAHVLQNIASDLESTLKLGVTSDLLESPSKFMKYNDNSTITFNGKDNSSSNAVGALTQHYVTQHEILMQLIKKFDVVLKMILKTLSQIIETDNLVYATQGELKEGDNHQFIEFIKKLEPALHKRKPRPCKEIMEEITQFSWSLEIKELIEKIDKLIGKYKFKEAQEIVEATLSSKS